MYMFNNIIAHAIKDDRLIYHICFYDNLFYVGECITAIVEKQVYIPYRASIFTR